MSRRRPLQIARSALNPALELVRNQSAGIAIEYALIAGLIAVAIIGALGEVGGALVGLPLNSLIDAFMEALS